MTSSTILHSIRDAPLKYRSILPRVATCFNKLTGELTNATCEIIWPHLKIQSPLSHHIYNKFMNTCEADCAKLWAYLDGNNKLKLYHWCYDNGLTQIPADDFFVCALLLEVINAHLGANQCEQIWPEIDGCETTAFENTLFYRYCYSHGRNAITFYCSLSVAEQDRLYDWLVSRATEYI